MADYDKAVFKDLGRSWLRIFIAKRAVDLGVGAAIYWYFKGPYSTDKDILIMAALSLAAGVWIAVRDWIALFCEQMFFNPSTHYSVVMLQAMRESGADPAEIRPASLSGLRNYVSYGDSYQHEGRIKVAELLGSMSTALARLPTSQRARVEMAVDAAILQYTQEGRAE